MRKLFVILFSGFLTTGFQGMAQCPGCVIDAGCTVTPAAPTLCPSSFPDGTTGQPYNQDLTFYMPAQFTASGFNVTLNQITVNSITGLPAGINWETSAAPSNIFYPSQNPPATERGCVKFCGTPTQIGTYNILVNITAEVSTPIGPISQQESFALPLTIVAPPGGNGTYTYNPSQGCTPLDVTFNAIISAQPAELVMYDWDFDNGNTSNLQNPPVQTFAVADTYFVSLHTLKYNHVLTEVNVNLTGSAWGADIDELFGLLDPDPFFEFSSGGNTQAVGSVTDVTSNNWTGLNFILTSTNFTLHFFDEDAVSANDDLGNFNLTLNGPGTFPFSNGEVDGTYTIDTVLAGNYTDIDTVIVLASPSTPTITPAGPIMLCTGLNAILETNITGNIQWYLNDTTLLIGEIADTLAVTDAGFYSVMEISPNGCTAESASTEVQLLPTPALPSIVLQGGLLVTTSTDLIQWNYYGNPIAGANQTTYAYQDTGVYSVTVTNASGCSATNYLYVNTPSGLTSLLSDSFSVFPNPGDGLICVTGTGNQQILRVEVTDAEGRIVLTKNNLLSGSKVDLDLTQAESGNYLLKLYTDETVVHKRIVILKNQ